MPDADPFDLNRFVIAQAPVFAAALDELKAGRKRSHWMWFIFPQLRSLGHSSMAEFYGMHSSARSRARLPGSSASWAETDPVHRDSAGSTRAVPPRDLRLAGRHEVHSSLTLFSLAARQGEGVFRQAIDRYCEGRLDERTVALCQAGAG